MRENQGMRIVEMFSCGTIQIVKFLFTGDGQRDDIGPHAAHEVQTDGTTGVAGRSGKARRALGRRCRSGQPRETAPVDGGR